MIKFSKKTNLLGAVLVSSALGLAGTALAMGKPDNKGGGKKDKNIVIAVVSPPVVANGTMAGEPTEIIAVLNAPGVANNLAGDPENFGHQIPAGGWMEVELGGTFERNGVDNAKNFVAIGSNANFVLVTGLPQMPITVPEGAGVQHGNYTIMDDGNHTIMVKPNGGRGDSGLEQERAEEIGFKVVHIRPRPNTNVDFSPFTNGPAGTIGTVEVRIYNQKGKLEESGSGSVIFQAVMGRRIGPTNVGLATGGQGSPATITAELVESVNFQHVEARTKLINTVKGASFSDGAPYAPRYLMFEAQSGQPDSFIPFKGIANVGYVVNAGNSAMADVVEDSNLNGIPDAADNKIGKIAISGPTKNSTGMILDSAVLTTSGDGVSGTNGSVMSVPVMIGKKDGVYRISVTLDNGNTAITTIIAD